MSQIIQTLQMYVSELYLDLWIISDATRLTKLTLHFQFTSPDNGRGRGHTNYYSAIIGAADINFSVTITSAENTTTNATDSVK